MESGGCMYERAGTREETRSSLHRWGSQKTMSTNAELRNTRGSRLLNGREFGFEEIAKMLKVTACWNWALERDEDGYSWILLSFVRSYRNIHLFKSSVSFLCRMNVYFSTYTIIFHNTKCQSTNVAAEKQTKKERSKKSLLFKSVWIKREWLTFNF